MKYWLREVVWTWHSCLTAAAVPLESLHGTDPINIQLLMKPPETEGCWAKKVIVCSVVATGELLVLCTCGQNWQLKPVVIRANKNKTKGMKIGQRFNGGLGVR